MSLRRKIGDALDVFIGRRVAKDVSEPSIRIPYSSPGLGAKFGEPIVDSDLTFAVKREPVAHLVVFGVAHDVFDNWFTVDNAATEGKDEKFDEAVQAQLSALDAKNVFTEMAVFERAYGWAIIVIGYDDSGKSLEEPVENPKTIVDLAAYAPTSISGVEEDKGPDSLRYGLPEYYRISRGGTTQERVHFSRVIHFATRILDHAYKGLSVLEPVWDDLTNIRNIRWGLGQTMYRYGSGFPDIEIQGASKEQLDAFTESGQFKDLHARTYFVHNEKQKMEFKGASGVALNPAPYYEPILEALSAGSRIPKAIIRGAQAGALTGSEVNEREYFKLISDAQSRYEPGLRFLIDRLIEVGQVKSFVKGYAINWAGGFEVDEREQAAAELTRNQANQVKLQFMTVNEVRAENSLDPVEGGEVVIGLLANQPQTPFQAAAPDIQVDEEILRAKREEARERVELLRRIGRDLQ